MPADLELRRRRAIYRASHRGTKEMDLMLGRFVAARIGAMDAAEMDRLEQLLALPDPDLSAWLIDPAQMEESALKTVVEAVRAFHGIADTRPETK